jgi:hypothetical protein
MGSQKSRLALIQFIPRLLAYLFCLPPICATGQSYSINMVGIFHVQGVVEGCDHVRWSPMGYLTKIIN